MNKTPHLISGFLILITVFLVVYKNSNVKGFRRFLISLKLAVIITFSLVSPADAKDNGFLPGADAWSNKPSISRPLRRNYGLFDSKTTSSSGEPKKDPYSNSEINSDSNENRPKSTNLGHHFYSQEKTSDDETECENLKL